MKAILSVKAVEEKVLGIGANQLTQTAAKNLAKLMAYKDEYEVARLYTRPEYLDKLRQTFAGEPGKDYELYVHMAPPAFAKKKANGELVKKAYGPWVFKAFKLLSKFKKLRGTALDPFGRTEERKAERALIAEYIELLDTIKAKLTEQNIEQALALAALPDDIRGYGHVKEKNMHQYHEKKATLLADFNA